MADTTIPQAFHFNRGSLFHHFQQLTHLQKLRRRCIVAVVIAWAPLLVLGALDQLVAGMPQRLLLDLSVHARLIVAIPAFILAEEALNYLAGRAMQRVIKEGFVSSDPQRFTRLVERAERLRDARLPELLILAGAFLLGIATLVGWAKPSGVAGVETNPVLSSVRVWFGVISLPLFNFLMFRAIWRWAIWTRVLAGLARLRLQLEPGHPDRRGGIGFLSRPSQAFMAIYLFAICTVFCAGWATRIIFNGARALDFQTLFLEFLVFAVVITFGPLLIFTPQLFLNVRHGRRELGGLSTDYIRRFRNRWLVDEPREELLGTPDIQSLSDISNVYRESVERATMVLFGRRDLLRLVVVLFIPTIPVLLTELPLNSIIKTLGELVLGVH